MTPLEAELESRCVAALRAHLNGAGESSLHAAYELGRDALERGFGILDFTAVLHAALAEVAFSAELGNGRDVIGRAESFLLECFSPFEMAHRGARAANAALRRLDQVREAESAGADRIHVDVMDGHFVPNITIGVPIVAALRAVTPLHIETHLMITNPDAFLAEFAEAGSDSFLVHWEGNFNLHRTVHRPGFHAEHLVRRYREFDRGRRADPHHGSPESR